MKTAKDTNPITSQTSLTFDYADDANGVTIRFDIVAAYAMRESHEPDMMIDVARYASRLKDVVIDPNNVEAVTDYLDHPVMLANHKNCGTILIDGNHRLAKAFQIGRATLPAFCLDKTESAEISKILEEDDEEDDED